MQSLTQVFTSQMVSMRGLKFESLCWGARARESERRRGEGGGGGEMGRESERVREKERLSVCEREKSPCVRRSGNPPCHVALDRICGAGLLLITTGFY